jgi:hypothetical protein
MSRTTVAAVLLVLSCSVLGAQSQQPASQTYEWSGELVSLDEATKTATIKSRIAYEDAVKSVKNFKVGDRILLWWSGQWNYSDAIRDVVPYTAKRAAEPFMLPVELASTETPNHYLTFKIRLPDSGVAAIRGLKPGEWVTMTSPHVASGDSESVAAIRPYIAAVNTTSATS